MFAFLKSHPFAVEAFFESSIVLTFAMPKEQLESMIPECLVLDILNDKWAFIAVAVVRTKGLRPKGFPEFTGSSFTLIGYRIFVRYKNNAGNSIRGLYILKSETDKLKMKLLGNLFTHYNYDKIDIKYNTTIDKTEIASLQTGLTINVQYLNADTELPPHSPFADWKEARKYAGPLPHTFTYNEVTKQVLIIKGVRENWRPSPLKILDYNIPFINSLKLQGAQLANAFIITNIPYHWEKGTTEQWMG